MLCCIKIGQQQLAAGRENFIFFLCPLDGEQFSLLSLPYLFDDIEQVDEVMTGEFGQALLDKLDELG